MQVRSTWVMELSELSAMTKSAMEKIKAFISRKHDRYRPPYGRQSRRSAPAEHLYRQHQRCELEQGPHRRTALFSDNMR